MNQCRNYIFVGTIYQIYFLQILGSNIYLRNVFCFKNVRILWIYSLQRVSNRGIIQLMKLLLLHKYVANTNHNFSTNNKAISRGVEFIEKIQHKDGGWGESEQSGEVGYYISLPYSTTMHTAMALLCLMHVELVQSYIRVLYKAYIPFATIKCHTETLKQILNLFNAFYLLKLFVAIQIQMF